MATEDVSPVAKPLLLLLIFNALLCSCITYAQPESSRQSITCQSSSHLSSCKPLSLSYSLVLSAPREGPVTTGRRLAYASGQPGPYFSAGLGARAFLFLALVHLCDCIYIYCFKVHFRHSAGRLARQGQAPRRCEAALQVGCSEQGEGWAARWG